MTYKATHVVTELLSYATEVITLYNSPILLMCILEAKLGVPHRDLVI